MQVMVRRRAGDHGKSCCCKSRRAGLAELTLTLTLEATTARAAAAGAGGRAWLS